jgi:death on curing protein
MKEPLWVAADVVLAIHEAQLAEHGGSLGIRDRGMLESALARPKNLHTYSENPTLYELTAAYASGIVRHHPFTDGNKRTAWVVCAVLLELNGFHVRAEEAEVVAMVVRLAANDIAEAEFAAWLPNNCIVIR